MKQFKKEVKIELNGNEYIFPLGIGFLGEALDNLGLTTTELFQKMDANAFKWSIAVMYESLKYQYEDELDFSKKEMLAFIDEDPSGITKIGDFNRALVKSYTTNLPQKETSGKPSKKK